MKKKVSLLLPAALGMTSAGAVSAAKPEASVSDALCALRIAAKLAKLQELVWRFGGRDEHCSSAI